MNSPELRQLRHFAAMLAARAGFSPRLDLWLAWRRASLGAAGREFVQHARRIAR